MTELGRASAVHSLSILGQAEPSSETAPSEGTSDGSESDGGTLTVAWGAATDIGRKRQHNEDSYLAESPLFVVADGMGGHAAGDVASAAVVTRLAETMSGDFADPASIISALRAATDDITRADDADELGVGTTVTGAALTRRGADAFWAVFNIGDSRVYRFADDALTQVTVDHSVVQELVDAGLISSEQAEFHPDSNVITRAVGFGVEPFADFWMLPVSAGVRLLICSDGLTREVSDEQLAEHLASGLDADATARLLVEAAVESGGRDNVTAIVVDVIHGPEESELDTTLPRNGGSV